MLIIQSVIGFTPALNVWVWPSPGCGPGYFSSLFWHICAFLHGKSLSYADATVVMPIDYLRVPLSAVIGYLLYAEAIDIFTACGAALILTGNLFNLRRSKPVPAQAVNSLTVHIKKQCLTVRYPFQIRDGIGSKLNAIARRQPLAIKPWPALR